MAKEDKPQPAAVAAKPAAPQTAAAPGGAAQAATPAKPKKPFPVVTALLVFNTAMVLFLLGLLVAMLPGARKAAAPKEAQAAHVELPIIETAPPTVEVEPAKPSWQQAEKLLAAKEYAPALEMYRKLLAPAQSRPADTAAADLLVLRQGQCHRLMGHGAEAAELLTLSADSHCAAIRAAANATLAASMLSQSRWSQARSYAYAAIAAMGFLDAPLPLETDCDFIISAAMTREVMSLHNFNAAVMPLWTQLSDPFTDLDDQTLAKLLEAGASKLDEALVAPVVHKIDRAGARRYSVACSQAPLEDLLARFGAESGVEIQWENVSPAARRRAITLSLADTSEQRLAEIACGMAALHARYTGQGVIIQDPLAAMPAEKKKEFLGQDTISLWRRLFLRAPQDRRVAQSHLAMAALYEMSGDTASALSEYHMIANRYAQSPAAPQALMQSAQLRIRMCDYTGASTDLLDLLDGHPNFPATDEAYLQLAMVAMQSGQTDEAIRSFNKLYFLDLSANSRAQAAMGLGRCFYQKHDLKEAGKWLGLYLKTTTETTGEEIRLANFMYGRCLAATGDAPGAVQAIRRSLAADTTKKHTVETTLELARFLQQINDSVGALGAVQQLGAENLPESQSLKLLLLESSILRSMGLCDKAASAIRNRSAEFSTGSLAVLEVELCRCRAAAGDLPAARASLAATLPKLDGADAWDATCELAEICLKLSEHAQVVTLCQGLLKTSCDEPFRRRALEALAAAYLAQKDYTNAASTYSLLNPAPQKEEAE